MQTPYTLLIHDEDGMLWAEVQELPGCFASGADMDELLDASAEAIQMYLADAPAAERNVVPFKPGRRAREQVHYAVPQAQILMKA